MRNAPEDHAYFDHEIAELVESINELRANISSRTAPDALEDFLDWDDHLTLSLNQFSAMYSRGYSPEQLRPVLDAAIDAGDRAAHAAAHIDREAHKTRTDIADYRSYLWLLSLAIAMRVSDDQFAAVIRATAPVHGDRLIDSLIISRDVSHPEGLKLLFPKTVGLLAQALIAYDPLEAIGKHLTGWARSWRKDTALIPPRRGAASLDHHFYGYWAFETLGVVTVLGLDDTRLEPFSLYPAALSPWPIAVEELPTVSELLARGAEAANAPDTASSGPAAGSLEQLTSFPINWEVSDVVELVEDLLRDRGLPGSFSTIEEEADEYEELGRREDGLEGHEVTIARMNHALRMFGWVLVDVCQGGDEHAVGAMQMGDVARFEAAMVDKGFTPRQIPAVRWGLGETFARA